MRRSAPFSLPLRSKFLSSTSVLFLRLHHVVVLHSTNTWAVDTMAVSAQVLMDCSCWPVLLSYLPWYVGKVQPSSLRAIQVGGERVVHSLWSLEEAMCGGYLRKGWL